MIHKCLDVHYAFHGHPRKVLKALSSVYLYTGVMV